MGDEVKRRGRKPKQSEEPDKFELLLDILIKDQEDKHGEGSKAAMLTALKDLKNGAK